MPTRTYQADVVATFIGKDKSLGTTFKKSGDQLDTFKSKLKKAGTVLRDFARGDIAAGKRGLLDLRSSMSDIVSKAAGIATAIVAAVAVAIAAIKRLVDKYMELAKQMGKIGRVAGTTAAGSVDLYAQFKMTGTDVDAGTKALGKFAKGLYDARRGTGPAADALRALGVEIKDENGEWRSMEDVLADTRDAISKIDDATTRAGVASALFGRGFQDLGKWLTTSTEEIAKFNEIARESGFKPDAKALGRYLRTQREISLRWELIQAAIGQRLLPLMDRAARFLRPWVVRLGTAIELLDRMPNKIGAIKDAFMLMLGPVGRLLELLGSVLDIIKSIREGTASPQLAQGIAQGLTNAIPGSGLVRELLDQQWLLKGLPVMASGGYVPPRLGGTAYRLGEAGEGEYVIPASKMKTRGGDIHVHIGTLVGTDERAARQLSEMVGKRLMGGVLRMMVGQNA